MLRSRSASIRLSQFVMRFQLVKVGSSRPIGPDADLAIGDLSRLNAASLFRLT
jgi:hypothetical protein